MIIKVVKAFIAMQSLGIVTGQIINNHDSVMVVERCIMLSNLAWKFVLLFEFRRCHIDPSVYMTVIKRMQRIKFERVVALLAFCCVYCSQVGNEIRTTKKEKLDHNV